MKKPQFPKVILFAGVLLLILSICFVSLPKGNSDSDISFKTSFDILKEAGAMMIQCKSIF